MPVSVWTAEESDALDKRVAKLEAGPTPPVPPSPPPPPPPPPNPPPTPLPPLVDGGFETPEFAKGVFAYRPAGGVWTFEGTAGISANGSAFTANNPDAPVGGQVAFVQMTGTVSQTCNIDKGTYAIAVRSAQRAGNKQAVGILIDAKLVGAFTPAGKDYGIYWSEPFTVTGGQHVLTFRGLNPDGGDNTAFLDAVAFAPPSDIPPPPPPSPPPVPVEGYTRFGWTPQRHIPDWILVDPNATVRNPALPKMEPETRTIVGQYRLKSTGFSSGGFAIDPNKKSDGTRRALVTGQTAHKNFSEFFIPPESHWNPTTVQYLDKTREFAPWRQPNETWSRATNMTTSDLCWYDGTFWDCVRPFYGQCGPQGLIAEDGRVVENGGQSRHSGFYKIAPGEKPYLGAMGTNSCREDSIGPALMTWEGTSLQEYTWYDDPDFAKRRAMGLVREPDAWLFGSHSEDVLAWMWAPVPIDGVGFLSGGIAYGGGIYDVKSKTFRNWTMQARGPLCYKWPSGLITPDGGHSENLALNELFISYEHVMQGPAGGTALPGGISSAAPYKIKGYSLFSESLRVLGKEIDEDGRLYLLCSGQWNGGDLLLVIYDRVT